MSYTNGLDKPTDYFNTKLYTGTGSGNQSVTGVGFQPDWVWTKTRSIGYGHNLYDSVRGTGKYLQSNSTSAESSSATSMVSFDSDGFTVGTGDNVQYATNTGVSWNWLASNTTASNTDGSITSTVSANTTAGFSIVSYTGNNTAGATIGHGLGVVPSMMIVKSRNSANPWIVYHKSIGETKALYLNLTLASYTATNIWNDTAPTSSVFSVGSNDDSTNKSNEPHIAYCFAEKQGYSKFGSYVGNGSTDGTFIYTGFKPAWFMCKKTDSVNSWVMFDNKRSSSGGSNEIDFSLTANSSDAEETGTTSSDVDFCANGIKIREDNGGVNASGGSYIYMCFASNPFTTSTGVPTTAK